jgi:nucleotidyltransferase/DNA polymerase involved in DNA repair
MLWSHINHNIKYLLRCGLLPIVNVAIGHDIFLDRLLVPGPEIRSFEEAAIYALRIKEEVCKQERITCSVGIGPNKLLQRPPLDIRNLMSLSS